MAIHPTAVIDSTAELGAGVRIGAYAVVEGHTRIGEDCDIGSFAVLHSYTELGRACRVAPGAVLGGLPQDAKFRGERSFLRIGAETQIREFATLHRASGEEQATVIGERNLIMAYAHVGHNSRIGDEVQIANSVAIAGHCVVEDYVNIGGLAAMHQFVCIGTMAMVAGLSGLARDVPPYMTVEGNPARPRGVNVRGLQRRGVSQQGRDAVRRAYRLLFRSGHNVSDALDRILREAEELTPEVLNLVGFMRRVNEGAHGRQLNPH